MGPAELVEDQGHQCPRSAGAATRRRSSVEHPLVDREAHQSGRPPPTEADHEDGGDHQDLADGAAVRLPAVSDVEPGDGHPQRDEDDEQPGRARPANLAWASRRSFRSRRLSAARLASRRSSSPPTSWTTSNVSQVASAVGSARRSFNTVTVRSKSVVRFPCAEQQRRRDGAVSGPRPDLEQAWGMGRPIGPVSTRSSSMSRGQCSRAAVGRRCAGCARR